jgi:hypothetical protein
LQVLRSGAITLTDGHTYRVEIGHETAVLVTPTNCQLIVRTA